MLDNLRTAVRLTDACCAAARAGGGAGDAAGGGVVSTDHNSNDSDGPICEHLTNIQQRKGEAEMGQIDWLMEVLPTLNSKEGEEGHQDFQENQKI